MSTVQTSPVLDKIRSRGYWSVVIRPVTFREDRVPADDLDKIILRNAVRSRWGYPIVDVSGSAEWRNGAGWIGQENDYGFIRIEAWRFYTSGLFVHYFSIAGDWRRDPQNWPPNELIEYQNTIRTFGDVFEFAARLAQSPAGDNPMRVEIDIEGLQARRIIDPEQPWFDRSYKTDDPRWSLSWEGAQVELIANPGKLAAEFASKFFAAFRLFVSPEVLSLIQSKVTR
jgi:hypothetical protein